MRRLIDLYRKSHIIIKVLSFPFILFALPGIVLFIGYLINGLVLKEGNFNIAGADKDWILFYGSLSSATITSVFAILAVTLSYSFSKLDEESRLKRKLLKVLSSHQNVYFSLIDIFYVESLDEIIEIDEFKLLNSSIRGKVIKLHTQLKAIDDNFDYKGKLIEEKLFTTSDIFTNITHELSVKGEISESIFDMFSDLIMIETESNKGLIKLCLGEQKTLSLKNNNLLYESIKKSKIKIINIDKSKTASFSKTYSQDLLVFQEYYEKFETDIRNYLKIFQELYQSLIS